MIGIAIAVVLGAVLRPPAPAPVASISTPSPRATRRAARRFAAPVPLVVYVAGAVVRPGLYRMPPGSRAADAVRLAGGMRTAADTVAVNLAAPLADGDEIAVPVTGMRPASRTRTAAHSRLRRAKKTAVHLDVNHATVAQLQTVPGIGAQLAQRIADYRSVNGPFGALDELADVAGMTASRVTRLGEYLYVSP